MKSIAVCALVLCSAISIDAGVFFRRQGRTSPPLSSYGAAGPVAAGSSFGPVAVSAGGASSFGGAASGFASFGGAASGSASFGGAASAGPAAPVVAIISETNNAPGTLGDNSNFDAAFEAENGLKQQASGSTVEIAGESVVVMKGSYEYIGDDGQTYVVDWIADENGFQPSAPHLPKDVPIPFPEIAAAVEAQIAFAAQEDAAAAAAGGSTATGGGFAASSGFSGSQSFGASSQSQSVAPLSSYGR